MKNMIIQTKYKLKLQNVVFAVLLLLSFGGKVKAQSVTLPAGEGIVIPNAQIELWMRADMKETVLNIDSRTFIWADITSNQRHYGNYSTAGYRPVYDTINNLLNFQPSLYFTNGNQRLRYKVDTVGIPSHFLKPGRSYYVAYISKTNSTNEYVTVFTPNSNSNTFGWWANTKQPAFELSRIRHDHQGNGKAYGINIVYVPNNASGPVPQSYMNGIANTTTFPTPVKTLNMGAGHGWIGGQDASYPVNGNIYELMVLSVPQGKPLAPIDLQKIHTYFALKYGITLGAGDYVSWKGDVIWSRSGNSGYNNTIFGLGMDTLHFRPAGMPSPVPVNELRQATSMEDDKLTVYLGTSLANLNKNNTGTIYPNCFILFGSNGRVGVDNYSIDPGTRYSGNNKLLNEGVEYRFERTYKIQARISVTISPLITIKQTQISVKLAEQEADVLFVSSREDFDPQYTSCYDVVNHEAKNVMISDGTCYLMYGVKKKALQVINYPKDIWLDAENYAYSTTPATAASWPSKGVSSLNFTSSNAARPTLDSVNNLMNFHPSVSFSGTNQLSVTSAALSNSNSYYLVYVSQSTGSASNQVVYTLNGANNNYSGWYNGSPSFTTNNTAATQQTFPQTSPKKFGITGVIRPNNNTDPQKIYMNGKWLTKPAGKTSTAATVAGQRIIGGTTTGPALPFTGNIQELIVYIPTTQGDMALQEVKKINSYLAIKYGLTLDFGDYVDDRGDVIWSRSKAKDTGGTKYEKMIFGIGRNGDMNIHQKQAQAYDKFKSPFAVFVGNWANLNMRNTSSEIPDKTFLMFSADQLRDFKALNSYYLPGTRFQNGYVLPTGGDTLNYISATFQTQGVNIPSNGLSVKFRNMFSENGNAYLLVSSDPSFTPSSTDIYEFNATQETTSILIKPGMYVAMVIHGITGPGGIFTDLRLWLKPDEGVTLNGSNRVQSWVDNVSGNRYSQTAAVRQPTFLPDTALMNFHPSVLFNPGSNDDNNGQYLSSNKGIMNVSAPPVYTFFGVVNNDFAHSTLENNRYASYIMGFGDSVIHVSNGNTRYPSLGITSNQTKTAGNGRLVDRDGASETYGNGNAANGTKELFVPKSTAIMYHEVHKSRGVIYEFDHYRDEVSTYTSNATPLEKTSAVAKMAKNNPNSSGPWGSTLGGASLHNRYLHGPLGEVIAFERELEQNEKDLIYSYLGLKYGITIDLDKESEEVNYDYLLSDGTPIWPGTSSSVHRKFHHNVAALVRDDNAKLNNKRATSTGDQSVVTMGIGTASNWTGFDKDKEALVWGSTAMPIDSLLTYRNKTDSEGNSLYCGSVDRRLRKIWLVDNSVWDYKTPGNPDSEHVQASQDVVIYFGGPYSAFASNYDVRLLIADSEDKFLDDEESTVNWDEARYGEYDPATGMYKFNYRFEKKYTYFTFGLEEKTSAGFTDCSYFTGGKTMQFTSSFWPNGSLDRTYTFNSDYTVNVTASAPAPAGVLANGYPRVYNNSSLQIVRTGATGTATVKIKPSKKAATRFEIFGIASEYGKRLSDRVTITGKIAGGATVYPKLYYKLNGSSSSTYTINRNEVTGKINSVQNTINSQSTVVVDFPYPMEEITIAYDLTGGNIPRATGMIFLGPIEFDCPLSLPAINEAGFSFAQFAPTSAKYCATVEYRFDIRNANCDPKPVNFIDTLPLGMHWESTSWDDKLSSSIINSYKGSRVLKLDGLAIPGNKTPFSLSATAAFDNPIAGQSPYKNHASISYEYRKTGVLIPDTLLSNETSTSAEGAAAYKKIVDSLARDHSCVYPSESKTFKVIVTNPNNESTPPTSVVLDLNIPVGFKVERVWHTKNGGLTETDLSIDTTSISGVGIISGLTLDGNSTYEFHYTVKMPSETDWPKDSFGGTIEFETGYSLHIETLDECWSAAFNSKSTNVLLYRCGGRNAIISNKHVTPKIKR